MAFALDATPVNATRSRWAALGVVCLCVLVLGLDATVLLTALPTLAARLHATTDGLQWIVDAYTLALGGLLIPAGALADRFGRRRLLLAGLAIFGAASLGASQATTTGALIAARALMGVGGAIVMPVSFSIVPTLFAADERPRALAGLAGGTFIGLPLGPIVAGWLLAHYEWGSIFLINVPVVLAALAGTWLLVPESRDPKPGSIDAPGALLAVAGTAALVYGIIEEPVAGWSDARVVFALAAGVLLLALFVLQERRSASPLIDLGWFRSATFSWATFNFAVVGAAMFGVLFTLTPFLQLVQRHDAQATGVRLLPIIAGLMAGAVPSDRLAARFGRRLAMAGGLLLTAAGALLLGRSTATSGWVSVSVAEAVIGAGLGVAMPPALDAILSALPEARFASGSALTRAIQNIAASFGVAVLGSILNGVYRGRLATAHLPAATPIPRAPDAYVAGMSEVLLVSAALMVAGALATLLFYREPGRRS